MRHFLRYHGLQALVAVALVVAAYGAYRQRYFADNFGVVDPGRLYRSRQLRDDTFHVLDDYHVEKIINLRPRTEDVADYDRQDALCRATGRRHCDLPIERGFPERAIIEGFLLEARSGRSALVHCQHGEVRTGILVACYRVVVNGWPVEKALREVDRFRGDLPPHMQRRLRRTLRGLAANRQLWLDRTDPDRSWTFRPNAPAREDFRPHQAVPALDT